MNVLKILTNEKHFSKNIFGLFTKLLRMIPAHNFLPSSFKLKKLFYLRWQIK